MESNNGLDKQNQNDPQKLDPIAEQNRIRSRQDIDNEITKINEFYNSRHNIVKKYLIHDNMKLNFFLWVIFSLFFYVLAFIGYYVGPDSSSQLFISFDTQGLAFLFMPLYLFACLFTVSALTFAIRGAVTTVPKIMAIPLESYEKTVKRFESNLAPLIIALPFILFDLVGIITKYTNSNKTFYSLIPTLILFISWVVEWLLFANILWLMVYYVIYIRQITKKYHYESELLSVVLKDEIKPIIHVGYEQSLVLGIFLIINIVYIIYKGFYISDLVASLLIFLLIPIISILPIEFVHKDLSHEIEQFRVKSLDRILISSKNLFIDEPVSLDNKMDFIFTDRILYRLRQIHKSHKNYLIYVKIGISLVFPIIGYYATYGQKAVDYINKTFKLDLHLPPLIHLVLSIIL